MVTTTVVTVSQDIFPREFIDFHSLSENIFIFLLLDPNAQEIKDIYGLHGQVEHKLAFLRTHVPKEMKLVVIGHSIGCYVALQILKHAPELPVSTSRKVTVALAQIPSAFLCSFVSCLIDKLNRERILGSCLYPFLHITVGQCDSMFMQFP